jgi:hypothetical protein
VKGPMCKWEDDDKLELREIGWGRGLVELAEDSVKVAGCC